MLITMNCGVSFIIRCILFGVFVAFRLVFLWHFVWCFCGVLFGIFVAFCLVFLWCFVWRFCGILFFSSVGGEYFPVSTAYWDIGQMLHERKIESGYGDSVVNGCQQT